MQEFLSTFYSQLGLLPVCRDILQALLVFYYCVFAIIVLWNVAVYFSMVLLCVLWVRALISSLSFFFRLLHRSVSQSARNHTSVPVLVLGPLTIYLPLSRHVLLTYQRCSIYSDTMFDVWLALFIDTVFWTSSLSITTFFGWLQIIFTDSMPKAAAHYSWM